MEPIIVDQAIAIKNPNFKNLIAQLNEKCKQKALMNEEQLQLAKERLQASKSKYFKNRFLYDGVGEVLTLDKTKLSESDVSSLRTSLSQSEVIHYLRHPKLSSLSDQMSEENNESKVDLVPLIENKIKERKEMIVQFYLKDDPKADLNKLAYQLKTDITKLETKKTEIKEMTSKREKLIKDYTTVLLSGISQLKEFLNLYSDKIQTDKVEADYHLSKCKTMHYKVLSLELSLLRETYPSEAVVAHGIMKNRMEVKKKELEKGWNAVNSSLEAYQKMGPEYEKLVDDYNRLFEQLKNKEWAYAKLVPKKN